MLLAFLRIVKFEFLRRGLEVVVFIESLREAGPVLFSVLEIPSRGRIAIIVLIKIEVFHELFREPIGLALVLHLNFS